MGTEQEPPLGAGVGAFVGERVGVGVGDGVGPGLGACTTLTAGFHVRV